jgi:tetratricopeptide (TPR) repeat protein
MAIIYPFDKLGAGNYAADSGDSLINEDSINKAVEIVYDAWEADTAAEAKKLAKKALKIDPDCCDAYNVLASGEEDPGKRIKYYGKAVMAFCKRHDAKFFKEMEGVFWGVHETRPFMRTLESIGKLLWEVEAFTDAITLYRYMLVLNPNDNQGVRYSLINWMFITGDLEGAGELTKSYKDDIGGVLFGKLLLAIIEKKTKTISKYYDKVMSYNPHTVPFLLKKKRPVKVRPDFMEPGSPEEAVVYLQYEYGRDAWSKFPEALKDLKILYEKKNLPKTEA